MHIHNYQIHNVLDLYRRQLSQENRRARMTNLGERTDADGVKVSSDGQRELIMETVSAEIVERIIREDGLQADFEEILNQEGKKPNGEHLEAVTWQKGKFTYTLIDERNQKITNTLTVREFSSLADDRTAHDSEKSLVSAASTDHMSI